MENSFPKTEVAFSEKRPIIKEHFVEFALIMVLMVNLFVQALPSVAVILVIIICQLFRLDFNSNAILLFFFLSKFLGAAFNSVGISGIGGYSVIIGAIIIVYGVIRGKTNLSKLPSGVFLLALLLCYFSFSMLTSSGGNYAMTKLTRTAYRGICSLIVFLILFSNFKRINTEGLGIYLMIYGFFMLNLSIDANGIPGPHGVFDFGFMRLQTREYLIDEDLFHINTHDPGLYCLQGLAVLLMKSKHDRSLFWISSLLCGMTVLYAGARQMIVILFVVLLLWVIMEYKSSAKGIAFIFFVFSILVVGVYYMYFATGLGTIFESTVEEGYIEGGGRGPWLIKGFQDFLSSPVFGIGFGRYSFWGDYATYPHNLIVELLAETGLVGFLFSLLLSLSSLVRNKDCLRYVGVYLLVLFLISMVSGGLYDNIVVFTLIFALPALSSRGIKNIF